MRRLVGGVALALAVACTTTPDGRQVPDWPKIAAAVEVVGQDLGVYAARAAQEGQDAADLERAAQIVRSAAEGLRAVPAGGEGLEASEALRAALELASGLLADEAVEDPKVQAALTALRVAAVLAQ